MKKKKNEEAIMPPQDILDYMIYGDTKTCKVKEGKSSFYRLQSHRMQYLVPSIQNMFG